MNSLKSDKILVISREEITAFECRCPMTISIFKYFRDFFNHFRFIFPNILLHLKLLNIIKVIYARTIENRYI
jgi:hypothetical protein